MVDQPQEMPNCKNAEENARDTQSSFWCVHKRIVKVVRRFVSKNARALYRTSAERCCLHKYADDREADEHECRTSRRQHDGALDQVRADKRGDNDQCPTKDRQQQNRPDDATDDEDDGRVLCIVHKERSGDRRGELSAR